MFHSLIKEYHFHTYNIGIIPLPSLSDEILNLLTIEEKKWVNSFHLPKRKQEILGEIALKNHFFSSKDKIVHTNDGTPFISKSKKQISISHSHEYVIMAIADFPIGIDLEKISTKVVRINTKFINEEEFERFDSSDAKTATQIWTIKEAIYKAARQKGIDFRSDINIKVLGELSLAEVRIKNQWFTIEIHTFVIDDYVISVNTKDFVQKPNENI